MQLSDKKEIKQLHRLISLAMREAVWDYSDAMDMAVVDINDEPLVFNREQLGMLHRIKVELEKEMQYV